ncbi:MAG TPA: NAD-dependent deacylase [Steroidobacteraceae bacterium]|jgi:NAD-dependent deacetylase|nr:NAD-dependent deacylase [Steroidobacteraceae bacterium]
MNLPTYSAILVDGLRAARRVVVLTGAGVSAESGIPTFRDKLVGLWENYEPADLATPAAFLRDAALVWGWYEWRRMTVLRAQPNAAHRALTTLRALVPELTLITQNVDDLHERAGSRDVLHLHGRLAQPYCAGCQQSYVFPPGIPDFPPGGERIEPPRCSQCCGKVRPGVVWFGEDLPRREWQAAMDAAKRCDIFLCIGTSSIVRPAATLTEIAASAGALTVQVNPTSTDADGVVSVSLKGPAGAMLPELIARTWGRDRADKPATSPPEVIVSIQAEGGSITLLGRRNSEGLWSYARKVGDQTPTLLDDEDGGRAMQSKSQWVTTWPKAVALLDRYPWAMLSGSEVHPEFRERIWSEVIQRLKANESASTDRARERWARACRRDHNGGNARHSDIT